MAHEITQNDNVVLHKQGAWHNLGLIVQADMTPRQALTMIKAEDPVIQRPIRTTGPDGVERIVQTHLANFIDNQIVGIVSSNYVPVQNADLADFCEALGGQNKVKVETAGTLRNKTLIWFLLKGEAFSVANGDEMYPYICVSNGHDGKAAFRVTPTTVRVVCSNTLHMVIPSTELGNLGSAAFMARHSVNVLERVEEAKEALKHYDNALRHTRDVAERLVKVEVNSEMVQKFFLDCYQQAFNMEIPFNPKSKIEQNRYDRTQSALASFTRRFDDERTVAGASLWNAFNAFSGLCQHDLKARGKDDESRVEKRVYSNLFGLNQDRTQLALQTAYALAD